MYKMQAMHVEELDLTQIRLLAELAERRSLSAAAARIGLSQSAASHALARLRSRLADPLCIRVTGGLRLTPVGERLARAARDAVEALHGGLADDRAFDPQNTDRVFNLFLSEVGQMVFLPRLLDFLHREAPGAGLRVRPIALADPSAALQSNEVDLAVGFFTTLTAGFHQSLIFRERYVCVVRADHPEFRKGMQIEAFTSTPHALADASGMAHAVIERTLKRYGIARDIKLRVPDFMVLPLVIASSNLLVIMPSRLAQAFSRFAPIKVLPPPVPFPTYDIRAYWHARNHNDPANRWLRQNFAKLFRREADTTVTPPSLRPKQS
jgi:DNA-binding transcriptional LysR family regulator